jgi:gamma-glutamyltranspeptidase/glutathione hydrolase
LPGGAVPGIGEVFRNPDLAGALRLIADAGASAFYGGPISEALLRTSASLGGTLAAADLTEFRSEWVTPISTQYRDWSIFELPPNSQGVTALEMLNILETFPLSDYACLSAEALHWKIEAQKLAFQDLGKYIADPRHAHVPTAGLLSKNYAAARAALIASDKAASPTPGSPPSAAGNTIYLSVVDAEGNIVSLIQSIARPFGSGIAVPDLGFHLHNRGSSFSLDPHHSNALVPRKRPLHTIIPAFMTKGDCHIGFGIMGGFAQPQAHAQFVCNLVDHGMNLQAALDAPRFVKLDFGGCDVIVEGRVPPGVREELTSRGHKLDVRLDYDDIVGGGQAVMRSAATETNYGASCARKDGAAIPEPATPLR